MAVTDVLRRPAAARTRLFAALSISVLAMGCAEAGDREVGSTVAGPTQLAAAEAQFSLLQPAQSQYGSFLAGYIASERGHLTTAADLMLQALAADPNNEELMQRAFFLVAASGRHEEATALAEKLYQINPLDALPRLVLAMDAAEANNPAKALEIIDGLPKSGLNKITQSMVGSWLALGKGDIEGARDRIAMLDSIEGLSAYRYLHLALLNDVGGASDAAGDAYRTTLESVTRNSLRLTWLTGNYFERAGELDAAQALYQGFEDNNSSYLMFNDARRRMTDGLAPAPEVADFKDGIAEVLFNLGTLISQQRYADQALLYVHQALRLRPDYDVAWILLGEILESQGRDNEAIAVYRSLPKKSPFAWTVRLRIAEALQRMERQDEAIRELEGMAAESPSHFEPLFRVGNMLRAQERFGEAVAAYDRAFDRLSNTKPVHWRMHYFRGIALERSGQWARAEKDLLAALDLNPEQPYVMNYLAYSWVEQETRLDEAKKMLERAVELEPQDGYITDSLGWVYYRLGEYDAAVKKLERAVELKPQDPVINDHLGDAYWKVNRQHEARFQWRRALSLEPEEKNVPSIESKIKGGLEAVADDI